MNVCVIIGSGYDCSWQIVATSNYSVNVYCPDSVIEGTLTLACTDFAAKRSVIDINRINEIGYDGMPILWHELKHMRLYSECMNQFAVTHFKCAEYASWHESWQ